MQSGQLQYWWVFFYGASGKVSFSSHSSVLAAAFCVGALSRSVACTALVFALWSGATQFERELTARFCHPNEIITCANNATSAATLIALDIRATGENAFVPKSPIS